MGYYATLDEADFTIPADRLDAAYDAMCRLNTTHDAQKRGGSYSGGRQTARWFSWMDENYPETCKDAGEILGMLGFDFDYQEDGSLRIHYYDSKVGQEELFIEAIAPLVPNGSYLVWRGEDGAMWRQEVRNGELVYQSAVISWE